MIIGLTGSYCSGKDSVAEYLVAHKGFLHLSLSDELRRELAEKGIEPTRENLIVHGTALRRDRGNGILAQRVKEHMNPGRDYVITSIRHPEEISELQTLSDFFFIHVDAPAGLRFARMQKRQRPGDPTTFETFLALEQKESQTSGSGQQLSACCARASRQFINDSASMEELHAAIDALLVELRDTTGRNRT